MKKGHRMYNMVAFDIKMSYLVQKYSKTKNCDCSLILSRDAVE